MLEGKKEGKKERKQNKGKKDVFRLMSSA